MCVEEMKKNKEPDEQRMTGGGSSEMNYVLPGKRTKAGGRQKAADKLCNFIQHQVCKQKKKPE